MPGSVTSELFLFLVDAGLLSRTDELEPASADGALVWLPARIHDSLCNGTFVASVVREVRTRCGLGGEPLATLQGSSYTSRAFNWSSVLASLEHDLSLTVDKPTRQKLNSGDMATATLVLSALCEAIVDHIGVPDDGYCIAVCVLVFVVTKPSRAHTMSCLCQTPFTTLAESLTLAMRCVSRC